MAEQGKEEPPDSRDQSRFGPALALGTNMAAGMILLAGLGYWIDRKRGGGVLCTLCGLFLGLAYGMYELWKAVREINSRDGGQGKPKG